MIAGTERDRSKTIAENSSGRTWHASAFVLSVLLFLVAILPPMTSLARRYEFVQALQFSFFIAAIPALLVNGAPWRRFGVARFTRQDVESRAVEQLPHSKVVDRWAAGRLRHPQPLRSIGVFLLYATAACFWRTPMAVNALVHDPWLLLLEAVTLVGSGTWLWTELVESEPLAPRLVRPHRIALGAVSMWIIWILAYFVALSHGAWYSAYHHHVGIGISLSADQQLTAGMMWLVSGTAFISLIYWNLYKWLQSEEDPNDELHQLIRFERIRRGAGDASSLPS